MDPTIIYKPRQVRVFSDDPYDFVFRNVFDNNGETKIKNWPAK